MATLKQEFIFFNDPLGNIRPSTKIFAYELDSTTPKTTYMDVALTSPNAHPVVADGAGIFGPIFLKTGGYRIQVKDKDNVLLQDRDNINVDETTILSTSDFYFSDLVDAKLGVSISGAPVNLALGQVVRTVGKVTTTDGLGAEWIVVAAGTGTADDDLFADLNNGLQIQRLFNQLYTGRNLSDLENITTARTNLSVYSIAEIDAQSNHKETIFSNFSNTDSVLNGSDLTLGNFPDSGMFQIIYAVNSTPTFNDRFTASFLPLYPSLNVRTENRIDFRVSATNKVSVVYDRFNGFIRVGLYDLASVLVTDYYINEIIYWK